jgi:hypothetical protein
MYLWEGEVLLFMRFGFTDRPTSLGVFPICRLSSCHVFVVDGGIEPPTHSLEPYTTHAFAWKGLEPLSPAALSTELINYFFTIIPPPDLFYYPTWVFRLYGS